MHSLMKPVALALIALLAGGPASLTAQTGQTAPPSEGVRADARDPMWNQGPKAEAIGQSGMATTQLASGTLAALKVLQDGGNAVDAAITAAFLQQVDDYHMV